MSVPEDFWLPFETTVSSFDEFRQAMQKVYKKANDRDHWFAWRGVVDARWGLYSSLYRHARDLLGHPPDEREQQEIERQIVDEFKRWGLHNGDRGRAPVLDQLATLQHYGAPTRLVDVSFNAYVGLWFAVEPKPKAPTDFDAVDGRVFAIEVGTRIIDDRIYAGWDTAVARPWVSGGGITEAEWCTRTVAWIPAPFERRIAAQQGAFILGGAPVNRDASGAQVFWPKDTSHSANWAHTDVVESTCLPLRPHKLDAVGGRPPLQPVYTIRIAAAAKQAIREELADLFGYEHRTLFPDYAGFASFAKLYWDRA